jgi:hypothetical protein
VSDPATTEDRAVAAATVALRRSLLSPDGDWLNRAARAAVRAAALVIADAYEDVIRELPEEIDELRTEVHSLQGTLEAIGQRGR